MAKKIPVLIWFVVFASLGVSLRAGISSFTGVWSVDVAATKELVKQSPKYKAEEAGQMEKTLTKMMESMTLTVEEGRITMAMGKRTQSLPYTLEPEEGAATKVRCVVGEQTVYLTFTEVGDRRINLKSSVSGDMDYYVWQPATKPAGEPPGLGEMTAEAIKENQQASGGNVKKTIEANLRTILSAAEQYALENGTSEVSYAELLKGQYFKTFKPVNGEDYASVKIDVKAATVAVTDKDGVTYSVGKVR